LFLDQKSKTSRFATLGDWCDNLKVLIRKSCTDFSACKWWAVNHSRTSITKQLICAKHDFPTGIKRDDSEIKSLQGTLSAPVLQDVEGAKISSRAQWTEEGEKWAAKILSIHFSM